jgi:hypothetical protein
MVVLHRLPLPRSVDIQVAAICALVMLALAVTGLSLEVNAGKVLLFMLTFLVAFVASIRATFDVERSWRARVAPTAIFAATILVLSALFWS